MTLVVGRWSPRRGRAIDLRPGLVAFAAWLVPQVPALLVGPGRWWDAIWVHLRRSPNLDSTVAALEHLGSSLWPGAFWDGGFARLVTVVTLGALAGGAVLVARRLRSGRLSPTDAALALVGLFLLTSKVFSPQFVLWILPLAVAAGVSWWPVVAVEATNAAVWLLFAPWLATPEMAEGDPLLIAAQAASVLRTVAVAWLVLAAVRTASPSVAGRSTLEHRA